MSTTYYRKAVRSHSMPNRFVLPSEEMGEYEGPNRRKSAPARPPKGGLYPLNEEGEYGAPPAAPLPPPPPYKPRERKPKVYSSYAVDNKCCLHGKKLADSEKDHGDVDVRRRRPSWAGSRRSSASPAPPSRRTVSQSPSRAPSSDRSTSSAYSRSSQSPEPVIGRKSSIGRNNAGYNSSSSTRTRKFSTSSGRYGSDLRDSSFEENEEYEYEENQRRKNSTASSSNGFSRNTYNSSVRSSSLGRPPIANITNTNSANSSNKYSSFARKNSTGRSALYKQDSTITSGGRKDSQVSLNALRKPKIDSWDSMGILGLTTKIWNDTKKRQETFMQSTGQFLREEN